MRITIINGPNLNLLGKREHGIYGTTSFETHFEHLCSRFPDVALEYFQSNIEGELVDKIQQSGFHSDAIVLNAAAYTHTSVAIGDAVKAVPAKVIEVHLSNTAARESFRQQSFVSAGAIGVISGFGLLSYDLALHYLIQLTSD